MSLRYAILGLLSRDSLTGYDLAKRFETMVASFWSAGHSQIYPELAALHAEGMVTFDVVMQGGKPSKKIYTITDSGREALAGWVTEPQEKGTVKDPLLMRTWAIGEVDHEGVLPQMEEALARKRKRLETLERAAHEIQRKVEQDGPRWRGPLLTLELDLAQTRAYEAWLERAIASLADVQSTTI